MKIKIFLLAFICATISKAQEKYTSESGIIFKIGDTITLGQPISHLGWKTIYRKEGEDYITNKNLVDKNVIIKSIDTTKSEPVLIVEYKRRRFFIKIDDALKNKEVMLSFKRELAKAMDDKYEALKKLKELLDEGIITEEEFEKEKEKILNEY